MNGLIRNMMSPPRESSCAHFLVHDGDGFRIADGAQGGLDRRCRPERHARGLTDTGGALRQVEQILRAPAEELPEIQLDVDGDVGRLPGREMEFLTQRARDRL